MRILKFWFAACHGIKSGTFHFQSVSKRVFDSLDDKPWEPDSWILDKTPPHVMWHRSCDDVFLHFVRNSSHKTRKDVSF